MILSTLNKKQKNTIISMALSTAVTLIVIFLLRNLQFIQEIELSLLNLRSTIKHSREAKKIIAKNTELHTKKINKSPDLFIIKMDNNSFLKYGQMPWKRSTYTIPLNKFAIGQLTTTMSWINPKADFKKNYKYLIYFSNKPVLTSKDLSDSTFLRQVNSIEPQIIIDHLLFNSGKYYFAITTLDEKGYENIAIIPGKNSSKIPVIINIKPSLIPNVKKWKTAFIKKYKSELVKPRILKRTTDRSSLKINEINLYLNYPNAIFFDIFFLDHKNKKDDNSLIQSMKKNNNIFVDYFLSNGKQTQYKDHSERLKNIQRFSFKAEINHKNKPYLTSPAVDLPIPEIIKHVKGAGFANPKTDSDDYIRSWPLITQFAQDKYPNRYYPSIPLLLAMNYFKVPLKNLKIKLGDHIIIKDAQVKIKNKKGIPVQIIKKDIKIPIDQYGLMNINYIGQPGIFCQYADDKLNLSSFSSFDKYPLSNLHDKIYLIGLYEQAIQSKDKITDYWPTPMGQMFGIEIIANTLNTIITENFLYKVNDSINILILLFIGISLGCILSRFSILKGALIALGYFLVLTIGSYLLYVNNYIIEINGPMLSLFFIYLSISIQKTLFEEKEKKFIKNQFSKFVNKEVVEELLQDPEKLKLGGERREMTVLFSDIRNFTTLSEKMHPEELVTFLNEYLESMTNLVLKNFGTLDKYVGDEIMTFWGAPLPQEKHAYYACLTAIEMMEELNRLNNKWPETKRLNIGIGINSGPMLVGMMGSESRMDYTIIGDCVNLGARLEGTNKYYKTNIIIGQTTYNIVKNDIIARELDLVRVKGKNKPVRIYELLDIKK